MGRGKKRQNCRWTMRGRDEILGHMVWGEIPHCAGSPAPWWLDEMSYLSAPELCPLSRAREKSLSSQPASQLIRVPVDLYCDCCHTHMPNFRLCYMLNFSFIKCRIFHTGHFAIVLLELIFFGGWVISIIHRSCLYYKKKRWDMRHFFYLSVDCVSILVVSFLYN